MDTIAPAPAATPAPTVSAYDLAAAYFAFSVAQRAVFDGDAVAAERWLGHALEFDPDSAFLHTFRAELRLRTGDVEGAKESLAAALAADPSYLPAVNLQAGMMVAFGRGGEAIPLYERSIALDPERIDSYEYLVDLYISSNKLDRAEAVLERMKERFGESGQTWVRIGRLAVARGDLTGAREAMERVVAVDPDNEEALLTLAYIYENDGDAEAAIDLYERRIHESSGALRLRAHLVSLYLRTGRIDDAERENRQLALYGFDEDVVLRNRGLIALERDDLQAAAEAFGRALTVAPGDDVARYYLGSTLIRLRRFEDAIDVFESIPADSDLRADARFGAGLALRWLGRYDEAAQTVEEAIADAPGKPDFKRLLALIYADRSEFDRAEKLLKKLIAADPDESAYVFALGAVYERAAEYEKGVRLMKKFLADNPDNPDAHNYIGYTYTLMGERLDEAKRHIDTALAARPGEPFITDSLGWLYFKTGDLGRAVQTLEEAAAGAPDEPVVHQHLGEVHAALGHVDRAREAFSRALALTHDPKLLDEIERQLEALGP